MISRGSQGVSMQQSFKDERESAVFLQEIVRKKSSINACFAQLVEIQTELIDLLERTDPSIELCAEKRSLLERDLDEFCGRLLGTVGLIATSLGNTKRFYVGRFHWVPDEENDDPIFEYQGGLTRFEAQTLLLFHFLHRVIPQAEDALLALNSVEQAISESIEERFVSASIWLNIAFVNRALQRVFYNFGSVLRLKGCVNKEALALWGS